MAETSSSSATTEPSTTSTGSCTECVPNGSVDFTIDGSEDAPSITEISWLDLAAIAEDDDGIDRVEFYAGGTLVGIDREQPFQGRYLVNSGSQSGIQLYARAYDTLGDHVESNAISITTNLPSGGTPLWSESVPDLHHLGALKALPAGDILLAATRESDDPGCLADPEFFPTLSYAAFARLPAGGGAPTWLNLFREDEGSCRDEGVEIASGAGIVAAIDFSEECHFSDCFITNLVRYDLEGDHLGSSATGVLRLGQLAFSRDGRLFIAGETQSAASVLAEYDPLTGDRLWLDQSDWGTLFYGFFELEIFQNGDFLVAGGGFFESPESSIARMTRDEILWHVSPPDDRSVRGLALGGPLDRIALALFGGDIVTYDEGGELGWSAPGEAVAIDPNGDIVTLLAEGATLTVRKLEGDTGELRWERVEERVSGTYADHLITVDEQGFVSVAYVQAAAGASSVVVERLSP